MTLLLFVALKFLLLLGGIVNWLLPPWFVNGHSKVYSAACEGGGSISLDVSVYSHPFDFELGDGVGWGLFYHPDSGATVPVYNDNFLTQDRHGVAPAPFVGWRFDGKRFVGPAPTYTYTPLPIRGSHVRVFDAAAQVSDVVGEPRFMNVFISPQRMPAETFAVLADCLASHRDALDKALASLGGYFPARDGKYYRPLKLGGAVYGPPPYEDPAYVDELNRAWGATKLPDYGRFKLFRGHSVDGTVNGRPVRLSLDGQGEASLEVDGTKVTLDRTGKSNLPDVYGGGGSWLIDGDICGDDTSRCGKRIMLMNDNGDLSATFWVLLRIGPHTFSEQKPQPAR